MQGDSGSDRDKGSLAERAASRLTANKGLSLRSKVDPVPEQPVRAAPKPPPQRVAAPPVEPPPAEDRAAPSETQYERDANGVQCEINFQRLQSAGFITPTAPNTPITEEFRIIKRQLLKSAFVEGRRTRSSNSNVIMVTSAVPGEGKTFISLNLAMSFSSERDLFVLLIDGDSHRRSLGDLLGAEKRAGLVDLLTDSSLQLRDVLQRTNIPNVTFLGAGQSHPHAAELLASKQAGALMQDLAARYPDRMIIIDTPPVLASTEAAVLSAYVGQTLVVVEKDRTSKRSLRRTLEQLDSCPSVSCVLNLAAAEDSFAEYGY